MTSKQKHDLGKRKLLLAREVQGGPMPREVKRAMRARSAPKATVRCPDCGESLIVADYLVPDEVLLHHSGVRHSNIAQPAPRNVPQKPPAARSRRPRPTS